MEHAASAVGEAIRPTGADAVEWEVVGWQEGAEWQAEVARGEDAS